VILVNNIYLEHRLCVVAFDWLKRSGSFKFVQLLTNEFIWYLISDCSECLL